MLRLVNQLSPVALETRIPRVGSIFMRGCMDAHSKAKRRE
jgi:hypothetical protein